MVWRVVADAIWRIRSAYAITVLAVGLAWMAAGNLGLGTGLLLAVSMAAADYDGPFVGVTASGQKELIYLPLSRRQLWTARWTLAVVVPVVFLLTAKWLGLAGAEALRIPHPIAPRTVWLSSAYDLAYVGVGLSVLLWSGGGYIRPRRVQRTLRSWVWVASVIVFIAGPVWPLLFRAHLATEWSALSIRGWLLLSTGLGLTVWSFLYEPAIAHPGRKTLGKTNRTRSVASYGTSTPALGFARLMWPELALAVGIVTIMMAISSFDDQQSESTIGVFFPYLILCLPAPRTLGPEAALRALRALPLSTWRLTAILAAKPIMMYAVVWLLQEVLRSGFGLPLPHLTLGMTCWVIGVASVSTAATLKFSGKRALSAALLLYVVAVVAVERLGVSTDLPFGWLPVSATVVGVGIALCLNFHTLRRSNSVYKAVKYPAMFATQGPSA